MEKEFRSIKLYEEEIMTLLSLPDRSQGRIFKAILSESVGQEIPQLNAMETAVYKLIYAQIKRAEELSNKRKQSANARWKDSGDIQNDTNTMQTSCKSDAKLCTNTITNTNTNTKTPLPSADAEKGEGVVKKTGDKAIDERFERFWSSYPKKVSKQDALKAWKKLKPDEQLTEKMLNALEKFKRTDQWQKENGQFIPYPASWLNARRWEDEESNTVITCNNRSSSFDTNRIMESIKTRYRTTNSA